MSPTVSESSSAPPVTRAADAARVLIVDDDPHVLRLLGRVLGEDHDVTLAVDGREGLDRACAQHPDLIVTDLVMPALSGDELVQALRSREDTGDIPVLVLTALADEALRNRLLDGEVQDYLLKPVSVDELRARVRNLLDMKRARDVLQAELARRSGDLGDLARDLADRKRELDAALEESRVAREAAEEANHAKDRLLDVVSHELRSPLMALRLQLYRLRREPLSAQGVAIARALERASSRLDELVETLLEHVATGRLEVRWREVDVAALLQAVLDDLRPRAAGKGLELALTVAPDVSAWSDPRLLRVIVRHLVDNAIKFTERGQVDVSARLDAGTLTVVVGDTGVGVSPALQAQLFQPFMHGEDPLHKHTPGLGLGLSLVRQLTEALGGRVTVTSLPGAGSTFTVSVPSRPPTQG